MKMIREYVISIILFILEMYSLFSGNMLLFIIAFILHFSLFGYVCVTDGNEKEQDKFLTTIMVKGLVFLIIFVVLLFSYSETTTTIVSEEFSIYHVSAPFGILWLDTSGNFVLGCGNIDTELRETYSVKYFRDDKLFTLHLDALKNSPIIDGKFVLEEITTIQEKNHPFWNTYYNTETQIVIHLPALPEQDGITREYKIVG